MVIHTGKETRMEMNMAAPRQKVGTLDNEVNWLSKMLFVLMVFVSAAIIVVDGFYGDWYFKFFRLILLLCAIIPISMRINLDMAKIFYSYQVEHDPSIEGAIVRNRTIPEELGRLQYLLSDKTGTLTQNDMIFKKISMEFAQYGEDDKTELTEILAEVSQKTIGPYGEMRNTGESQEQ
jgi:phospholipid-translocating ATPase